MALVLWDGNSSGLVSSHLWDQILFWLLPLQSVSIGCVAFLSQQLFAILPVLMPISVKHFATAITDWIPVWNCLFQNETEIISNKNKKGAIITAVGWYGLISHWILQKSPLPCACISTGEFLSVRCLFTACVPLEVSRALSGQANCYFLLIPAFYLHVFCEQLINCG